MSMKLKQEEGESDYLHASDVVGITEALCLQWLLLPPCNRSFNLNSRALHEESLTFLGIL